MPKITVNANELHDTDVNFVSLVKRGANQIPFRITKQENEPMLDLAKIGRKFFKNADATPAVIAILLNKTAAFDANKAKLLAQGFNVEKSEDKGDFVIFTQGDAHGAETQTLKINDDLGMVVTGLAKAFVGCDFTNTSFGEVMATESFYPAMYLARDILGNTFSNIMSQADSPADAATALAKACDDFKNYITVLAKGIPVQAFKADKMPWADKAEDKKDAKVEEGDEDKKKAKAKKDADDAAVAAAAEAAKKPAENTPEAELVAAEAAVKAAQDKIAKAAADKAAAAGTQTKKEDPAAAAPVPPVDEPKKDAAATVTADQMTCMFKTMLEDFGKTLVADVQKSVGDVRKDFDTLKGRVETVAVQAQKADEAARGTVITDHGDDDRTGLKKSGGRGNAGVPPLLDTAYGTVN